MRLPDVCRSSASGADPAPRSARPLNRRICGPRGTHWMGAVSWDVRPPDLRRGATVMRSPLTARRIGLLPSVSSQASQASTKRGLAGWAYAGYQQEPPEPLRHQ